MFHMQANVAQLLFETPALTPDAFHVVRFTGEEALSQLSSFEIELVSDDPAIGFADVINQPATLKVLRGEEEVPIHGLVADFQQGGRTADLYSYRAVLVPRVWLLSLNYQSRIFQKMTVDAIVSQVLEEAGFAGQDYRFELSGTYPAREYCVQLQETDLDFMQRLLEHEGICYYFEHGDTDVLVMRDESSGNAPISGEDTLTYNPGSGLSPASESVREFVCRERVVTGKVMLKDYNHRTPDTQLLSESQINGEMPGLRYEYGQHFDDQGEGDRLAQLRNEEIECRRRLLYGDGNCPALRSGHLFDLEGHYRADLDGTYLLTHVRHIATQAAALPGLSQTPTTDEQIYRNEFTCIPADVPYRPPRITPVPRVSGIMTGVTETGGGDYAYIDENGEYRLKHHFDLSDVTDGEASLPIRKGQPYSGPSFGMHFPEHANTEMIWACVNGDPDRPVALLTGPNPSQASPVSSGNKTANVIKTFSNNVISMDDTMGAEHFTISTPYDNTVSAGNDQTISVGNNQSESVAVDQTLNVGSNQTASIGADQSLSVGGNQTIGVGGNRDKSVGGSQSESVSGDKSITVGGGHSESIGAAMSQSVGASKSESIAVAKALSIGAAYQVSVGAAMNESIGGVKLEEIGGAKVVGVGAASSENVGANKSVNAGGNISENAAGSVALKAGGDFGAQAGGSASISAGGDVAVSGANVVIDAKSSIVLKCGGATITLKGGNVTIKGTKVGVNGSGGVKIDGSKVDIK